MKKFAAVAVLLAAFGLRAGAQEMDKKDTAKGWYAIGTKSRILIQGRAYMDVEGVWASGATNKATQNQVLFTPRVQENSAYLNFRGEYDLGQKWTAWAQIQSEIGWDGVVTSGTGPFSAVRNSAIGITGPYGTFFWGNWDTPFKDSTTAIDPWAATGIQSTYNVNGQMLNSSGASGNRWNSRMPNSISYMTPKFSGLYARVAAGFGEGTISGPTSTTKRPWAVSAGVFYDNGPLYLAAAAEQRESLTLGAPPTLAGLVTTDGTDQGLRLAGQFKIPTTFTTVAAGWEFLKARNNGTGDELKKWDAFLSIVQGLGSSTHEAVLIGGYASDYSGSYLQNAAPTGLAKTNDSTGAWYWSVGYRYWWTRDLYLYLVATQIANSTNAVYNFGNSAIGGFTTAMAGASPTGVAAGMYFLF